MQDIATVVLVTAALAQGVAAIVIAVLTRGLSDSTRQYAESADRQVEELKKQVDELVNGRLAAVQPYVHVTGARLYDSGAVGVANFLIQAYLANFGTGPALSVRGQLSHDWLVFPVESAARDLAAGEGTWNSAPVDLVLNRPSLTSKMRFDQPFPTQFRLRIEYRDMAGRWWATQVSLRGAPKLGEQWEIAVEDQQEQISPIPAPTLAQQLPAEVAASS